MRLFLRRTLHLAGSALALFGIIFVFIRLNDYGTTLDFSRFDAVRWSVVVGLTLLYSFANLMLALAWWHLLGHFGASVFRRWAIKTYGISQLARYVPGNIFHLAGRQAMGMATGVPGWALAKSSVWELGLISIAGVMFCFLASPLLIPSLPVAVSTSVFVTLVVIVAYMFWILIGRPVAQAFGWYVGFLAISGLLFTGLIAIEDRIPGFSDFKWLPLCGAYVLAWLIGLVTPGAPAGIGVRELVLLFLLKGEIAEADLVFTVLVGRIITVFGDFLFFLFSGALKKQKF